MSQRIRSRVGFRAAVVLGVAFVPLLVSVGLGDLPPPISITIDGSPVQVAPDTTFGQAIRSFSLHARPGRLLDVEGKVLQPRARPGSILLDGGKVAPDTTLSEGDAIVVVDGVDRTESTKRVVTRLAGKQPGNPQFALGTSTVLQITTEGRISGKVVSVRYRPVGKTTHPPAVALTFDDGPWPGSTRRVLGILERMHARATFFMVGYLARRYAGIVRDVIRSGMTIGNHSWDHPNSPPFKTLGPHRIQTEMSQMSEFMSRRFGITPKLFRPPGGSFDDQVVTTAYRIGMRVELWNVDPKDWMASATPRSITENVLKHVRPGSIVDLHDGGGDQSATVRALPRIIRGIRKMGLRLVTIGG